MGGFAPTMVWWAVVVFWGMHFVLGNHFCVKNCYNMVIIGDVTDLRDYLEKNSDCQCFTWKAITPWPQ